jgi:sialic acid synthase SpsE
MVLSQKEVVSSQERRSVLVVAEAGINHNGSLKIAKDMALASKDAGASAVKYQIYDTDELFPKSSPVYNDSKRGMLSRDEHTELAKFCSDEGVDWFATPFHLWAVELMEKLGAKRYKIASRSVSDPKLVEAVAKTGKPVIMSVGMSAPEEVARAMDILSGRDVTLLYCVCKYPTRPEDFRFFQMFRLYQDYRTPVGLSSHCPEIWPAVKAVSLGASVVEQHVTYSRNSVGCDMPASLTFGELAQLAAITKKLETIT